ncbi:MAG TPA: hypothetical protein VHF45_06960 [Thermoleophilaceae bacterium]|nr:hypothetical protein [Thermoleophilaceae bacterium]
MRFRGIAAIAAASFFALGGQALAENVSFEGEVLSEAPWDVADDSTASGGKALRMSNRTWVTRTVTTGAPSYWISVRAKGKRCVTDAQIAVRVDDVEVYRGPVRDGMWDLAEGELDSLPRGPHSVIVQFTNPGRELIGTPLECGRDVLVDRVTIHAPFADDSFRNEPLSDSAPLDPSSGSIVAALQDQIGDADARVSNSGNGAYVMTRTFSTPVYIVPEEQPPVDVWVNGAWAVQQQLTGAPLPPDARPADPKDNPATPADESGDMNLILYQPSTDTIWEFWQLRRNNPEPAPPNWHAGWGGRITNVSQNPGYFTYHEPPHYSFGASASRLSMLAGLQRIAELERGEIDHAVDMCIPNVRTNFWVWPAQFSDDPNTELTDSTPIAEGTRFRLPASYAIPSTLPRYTRTLLAAIKRYGLVVRDRGSNACFYAEDPSPLSGEDPYNEGGNDPQNGGIFAGAWPNLSGLLRDFPWSQLQVVAVPPGSDTGPFTFRMSP